MSDCYVLFLLLLLSDYFFVIRVICFCRVVSGPVDCILTVVLPPESESSLIKGQGSF